MTGIRDQGALGQCRNTIEHVNRVNISLGMRLDGRGSELGHSSGKVG
jgi:hypothetical protein